MNRIANSIKDRLTLRPPQAYSLNIVVEIMNTLTLRKNGDLLERLNEDDGL